MPLVQSHSRRSATARSPQISRPQSIMQWVPGRSFLDAADLRALQAEPGHQPLLVEEDRIHVVLECRGRKCPRRADVEDDDARPAAELEAAALVEIAEGGIAHEEQGIAERLNAGLEAVRGSGGVVVADRLATLAKRALAILRPEEKPSFHDARE